jgi:cysteine desulfurase/selenocysteine lyase
MSQSTETNKPAPAAFSVDAVRSAFPLLAQEVNGHPLIYLDNAATTQKPSVVIEAIDRYYRADNANIHRGVHALSQRATEDYEAAREAVAQFLGTPDARECVFVRGATEAVNLVAQCYVRPRIHRGTKVLITAMEHHANIVPWQLLRDSCGLELVICPVTQAGEVELATWQALLEEHKPLLASFVHVSNSLGTVNPAKAMIEAAKAAGAAVLLDAAQSTPHFRLNVRELGADFVVFSGHKVFGPTGIGALYGRYELLAEMPPYQGGGDMIQKVTFEKTTYKAPPERFEAGTPHIGGVVGLAAALRFLSELDRAGAEAHEDALRRAAEERLRAIPGLRLIGTAAEKCSVVSFVLESAHPHDIGTFLDQEGIAIRAGHHCTQPLMRSFGLPGTARASFAFYNTMEEVEKLVAGIAKIERFFR